MKVAAIQFAPEFKSPRNNLRVAARLVAEAARNGADLIVLPELITAGYSFMSAAEAEPFCEVPALLKQEDPKTLVDLGWSFGVMAILARKLGVKLVWGFMEKDPVSGKLYNSQAFLEIDPQKPGLDGIYYETYRKINGFGQDFIWSSPGESNPPVVRTVIRGVEWRIGLLICRDVRDKVDDNWTSLYEPGDADLITLSANWGSGGFPSTSWMDFVKDNKTTLVVSNRYGKEANNDFGEGGVCIIEKGGKVHCDGLLWGQDCVVYAELVK